MRCARLRRPPEMFDLRYHVASLAAVFLALIIGIVVGVGISGKGFVSDSERSLFNERIADLKGRLDSATKRGTDLARSQRAAQAFVQDAYPALMSERLAGVRAALVFAGAAMGVLMQAHKITDLDAFDLLRLASQRSHRKLPDVAEDVLLTGALPVPMTER